MATQECPCGHHGDGQGRCVCHEGQVQRYLQRVSGPLLDRIDIHVEVPAVRPRDLAGRSAGEGSGSIRERIVAARDRQLQRFRGLPGLFANAHMGSRELREWCRLDGAGESMLRDAMQKLGLSARAYHRVLKLARTIADLEGVDALATRHLAEAIQYRTLDRVQQRARVSSP